MRATVASRVTVAVVVAPSAATILGSGTGTVHAASARLVKDINPGDPSSETFEIAQRGNTVLFGADDGARGAELWRTDGSRAGTRRIKDIAPRGGSQPSWLTDVRGILVADGRHGIELWKATP